MTRPALPEPSSSWEVPGNGTVHPGAARGARRPPAPKVDLVCAGCGRAFQGRPFPGRLRWCSDRCRPNHLQPGSDQDRYRQARDSGLCIQCGAQAEGARCAACSDRLARSRRPQ